MIDNWRLQADELPASLMEPENAALLKGILRGIEREGLRVTPDGQMAQTPHPQALGSALTHPHITTDFSEALLEFITAPTHSLPAMMEQLENIHIFTQRALGDEILWNCSMPCTVGDPARIPVARYGTSNRARMKMIYREGLGHRYGRVMQTVAGLHFNFSLPTAFWAFLQQQSIASEDLRGFTTRRYFDLIRNFRRLYWLLIYLFGASPVVSKSFVAGREHQLQSLGTNPDTLYLPYATSLRMGDLGYQSKAQEALFVCYNTRNSYVSTLVNAIDTPYPAYKALGLHGPSGERRQLNCGLLQIENEFYSAIRPKRSALAGETALTALCSRGVEYVEVRCLDINPFTPLGFTAEQARFLDIFLLYCALKHSPVCDRREFDNIQANQKRVVLEGRRPGLQLVGADGLDISMQKWAGQVLDAMQPLAELFDSLHKSGRPHYRNALQTQMARVADPDLTPSAMLLQAVRASGASFTGWALDNATRHKAALTGKPLSGLQERRFLEMGEESLAMQADEERQPQMPFEDYLTAYYRQYEIDCRFNSLV